MRSDFSLNNKVVNPARSWSAQQGKRGKMNIFLVPVRA